ncbi:hypothetical protein CHS0354_040202 [Potamilus streckersoni]|uniref:HEPN domain-containing protein n=1 Tax=Potamilus streckersoni TaxID=2493646 RepID=A0AAE0SG93_9BIVA|nr:hypothetical protein CHS0354_040202 [Potamilus streckersoni]
MAEDDSDSDIEEFSSMEQPPLIKQLKTILAEYPDDGQIIKELIQNAEDAGASEVRILYDDRSINAREDKKSRYRKFLQGPALCFYNNATFTELDWKGIRMIYSSVKEEDPLKVGRFGLGFKSVFHITDTPVILSGDRILFMDPHRSSDRVCLTVRLSKLKKWNELNIDDILTALQGTFGVTKEILQTGWYDGTLFWFPLRSKASSLSDTLYDKSKVTDLFTAFQAEASNILIFLKQITKVFLYTREDNSNVLHMQFNVELVKNVDEVQQARIAFLTKIRNLNKTVPQCSISCKYILSICTKSYNRDNIVGESTTDWMVINYYKGGNMSSELKSLIQDESLGYSPLAGLAAPIGHNIKEFKGHVFCFLPLPQERTSVTGLPVHINGYFALSQNRRHIKWPSADQVEMHLHKDKVLIWNEKLLTEVLPDVYDLLIQEMIHHSIQNGNQDGFIECIYAAIPKVDQAVDIWKTVLPHIYRRIISKPTVLTVNNDGEKSWIDYAEAYFNTFTQYPKLSPSVKNTIAKVLRIYNKKYVEVPLHVVKFFFKFGNSGTELTPRILSTILKDDSKYRSLTREEKFDLLEFLMVDRQYEILDGLDLLPLNDESFIAFVSRHRTHDRRLLCSEAEIELFPGLDNMFVHLDQQKTWFLGHIQTIASRGQFQVYYLNAATFRSLLEETIKNHLGQTYPQKVGPFSTLMGDWNEKVWENIFSHGYNVNLFEHIPLVPLLKQGSWSHVVEIELYHLSDFLIVKEMQNMPSWNESVYQCLELLSIKVLPSLPVWLQRSELFQYVQFSTEKGLINLMDMLYNTYEREKVIVTFNNLCAYQDRKDFVKVLATFTSWTEKSNNFVKCLKLFTESGSQKRVSLKEISTIIRIDEFPVTFPHPYIVGGCDECCLARNLGARELDQINLVLETLQTMQNSENVQYSFSERQAFMHYFLQNIRNFEGHIKIMNAAKHVQFLRSNLTLEISQPSDLFDPLDHRLQSLFEKENKFPETDYFYTESDIVTLKKLGLKTYTDVTAEDLFETAKVLDGWCENGKERQIMNLKAKRFLEVLEEKSSLLDEKIQGISLGERLQDRRCLIHTHTKCEGFSSALSWFQSHQALSKPSELHLSKFARLVGSTMPLIESRDSKLASVFRWNEDPPIDKIVQQLENINDVYESHLKADLLPLVNEIYHKLSTYENLKLLANVKFQSLTRKAFVWNGDGFSHLTEVYIHSRTNDIDLSPYLLKIPTELSYLNSFFYALGCKKEQNIDTLLEIQNKIRDKYNSDQYSAEETQKDLDIIISILKRFSQEKTQLVGQQHKILFPIYTKAGASMLLLKPGTECTYCEARSLQDINYDDSDEEIYYVHEDVSRKIAEDLGIMSVKQRLLSKTDEFEMEVVGQQEPLTRRLHNLVTDGYLDGFSVIKEIVQNADDAKANVVYFLYDERENEDARNNLLHEGLSECQGPALWAYNDAEFQEKDFLNILKLNGATKEDDLEKIGKFGLGFCAVYNLTDVPSFISGSNFVMLDPHISYLGKPGIRIDLRRKENLKILTHFENQFKPFQNIFGCDLSPSKDRIHLNGTLFRFPLRTSSQAQRSEISNTFYSKEECVKLLELTFRAAGNLLLFTQNIRKVTIFHLRSDCADPKEQTLLFSLSKDCSEQQDSSTVCTTNVLTLAANLKECGDLRLKPMRRLQKILINLEVKEDASWLSPLLREYSGTKLNCSWILSWATGTSKSLQDDFVDAKWALPLCGVAVPYKEKGEHLWPMPLHDLPLGFYNAGHVFCFLPLPIPTSLPLHINGCFTLTSDRRHLLTSTEDDKCTTSSQWNQALMKDALVNAYIYLLEGIRDSGVSLEYEYHTLWPIDCSLTTRSLEIEFFKRIVSTNAMVFHWNGIWKCFRECIFLDPELRYDTEIGHIAFEVLLRFNNKPGSLVIDLPDKVKHCIESVSQEVLNEGMITNEQFVLNIFLPNLKDPFWSETFENASKRNSLVQFALMLPTEKVSEAIQNVECIPTEAHGTLKRPSELIDPTSDLSILYDDNDEVFPQGKETFRNSKILDLLRKLGMLHRTLPHNLLLERCHSVQQLASVCGSCALNRCTRIVDYLSNKAVRNELEQDHPTLNSLQQIEFLPVLQKPGNWCFSWKAEENKPNLVSSNICSEKHEEGLIQLARPTMLFFGFQEKLVCCTELVVDETRLKCLSLISRPVLRMLGVKGFDMIDIPHETVGNQLLRISEEYNRDEKIQQQICKVTLEEIYKYFSECLKSSKNVKTDELLNYLESFKYKQIIMIENLMVMPVQVARDLNHSCSPDLFQLSYSEWRKYEVFFKAIGIKEVFLPNEIAEILTKKKQVQKNDPLSEKDTDLVCNLLLALEHSLKRADRQCNEMALEIYAPDIECILQHTQDLCMDDKDISTSSKMKLVHGKISNELATSLGIKTKRLKHLEENVVGIPWGQKEKLVTRIRSLLGAYPCDESVLKELVQNADDAGANEIHFIKDLRTHECDKLLSDTCKPLQGPALCVYNDKPFTEKDLQGIQSLGMGSKSSDPSKTGKYGVGFNAVYHLTDVPSFLTKGPDLENGETLCIFDPMCKFVPTATEDNPGIKCNTQSVRQCYPDVLKGYYETDDTFFKSNCGTMFRFPLRDKVMSEDSLFSKEEISVERMNKILSESIPDMFESLLFLKHVSKIKISDITSGTLKEEYAVEAIISENDKQRRNEFFQYVDEAVRNETNENLSFLHLSPLEVGYTMTIKDSNKAMKIFYVVQRIGLNDVSKLPDSISYATKEHLIGHLPLAGVAASLPSDESLTLEAWNKHTSSKHCGLLQENRLRKSGRAFCFLPLPLQTGLPVHVNGHFMLDHESRRSLWKGDKGYSYNWNHALLGDTIAHAYVSCLSFMKTHIFKENYEQQSLNMAKMDLFNSYFPTLKDINDDYWKALLKYVYQVISDREVDIFPSIKAQEEHHVELKWFPLKRSLDHFPSFFDNLSSEEKNLIAPLRAMGMKIIKSSRRVQNAISSTELKLNQICPGTVLSFLLSYRENHEDCCKIQLDLLISNTNMMSTKNAMDLINFLSKDQALHKNLQDLPLLITNDDFIRCFDSEKPVFLSRYCELLPGSRDLFVHKDLVNIFDTEDFIKTGLFKYLKIQDLAIYLPNSIDPLVFASGDEIEWNLDLPEAPNAMWMSMFWTMLHENSMVKNKNGKELFEQACYEQNLKVFDNWSLLPCNKVSIEDSNNIKRWLIPIRNRNTVFHYNRSIACTNFDRAIKKIQFRCVDTSMFENFTDASAVMKKMVSTVEKPLHLLMCLEYHIDEMKKCDFSSDECNALLIYLTENLEFLKKNSNSTWLEDTIRSLPIHVTYDSKHVSFSQTDSVLVLPDEIPHDGITEWAIATNHILLIQNDNLQKLHAFLGFSYDETIDIYCNKIATSFFKLPEVSHRKHLEFIRDNLFHLHGSYCSEKEFNNKQMILLGILKEVPFVKCIDGRYKRVKDLFNPSKQVFQVMCVDTQFPPNHYKMGDWRELFVLLGFNAKLSDQHLLKFAREIEQEGDINMQGTVAKAECLLKSFWKSKRKWSKETLKKLSIIRFIPPYRVLPENLEIFKQPNDCNRLICFSGSVSSDFGMLCWSTLDLIPIKFLPSSDHHAHAVVKDLGVYVVPPVEKVIQHTQNICDAQSVRFTEYRQSSLKASHFRTIMHEIYTFLSENRDKDPKMSQKLQNTPLIFMDEKNILVKSTQVVIDIPEADTIEPYLYKAPSFYGQFNELFVFLGASRKIQIIHYAMILSIIKNEVKDKTLYANELGFLVQAMSNIVKRLPCMNGKEVELDIEVLYFPNRKGKLCNAKLLIVSDNSYFENRLSSESDIDYFMGFENLRIDVKDVKQIILCLPKRLRPSLLTDVVEEEIDTSEMNEIRSSKARKIGMFLKSSDFIHGVLRLVKHAIKDKFSEDMEENLIHDLQNVQIKEVTGLKTYLKFKGRRIEASKATKKCFMTKSELENNAQYTIYFQNTGQPENSLDDLLEDEGDLLDFIHACTGGILHDETTFKLMYAILRCFNSPQQIQVKLDEKKINQYNLTQLSHPTFPVPGTYVPREFHPFLEQGFSFFEEHEYQYLALEVEDPDVEMDDEQHQGLNNPVFKYVHIIEPVRSDDVNESEILCKYIVDTGNSEQGNTVVYGFQLYKFKRRKENKTRDVIPADIASVESFPLDETCRRIHSILRKAWTLSERERRSVIKRLWLKWHPDKNKGQEDYCQKVFNYINATILKLERGQPLDNYDGYNSGFPETFTGTRYETMSHRMRQRGSQYSREYDQYYEYFDQAHGRNQDSSSSFNGGATSFSVPLPTEAKRWMQQAKRDFLAAEAFFPSAESVAAFNWICYSCHQATEKALKAGGFAVDANSVPRHSHQLTQIAAQLSDNIRELAQEIQNCVGEHTRMRYPDSIVNQRIPSESYTEGHATEMLRLTRRVHDLVNEEYLK